MHIPVGDADQAGGGAASRQLHGVGIGAGSAGFCGQLIRDFVLFSDLKQGIFHNRVDIGASMEDGAFAECHFAELFDIGVGMVAGEGDVDGKSGVRVGVVRRGNRPAQADFFLDGGDPDDTDVEFAFGQGPHDFGDDEGAGLVVGGAGDEFVAVQFSRLDIDNHGITDGNPFFGLFFAACADIDPDIVHFDGFFTFFRLHGVDGFSADDAEDIAFFGDDFDALADEQRRVHAADLGGVDEAFVVDMRNHEADFIDMSGEHEFEFGFGVQHGHRVAVNVAGELVDGAFDAVAPELGGGLFESAGAGSFQERL